MGLTPSADEGSNLANGSSNTVELATNSSWTSLGRKHTEAVSRSELTEGQEDTVDDGEGTDMVHQANQ